MVYAGAMSSFENASAHLKHLAELDISGQRIRRATLEVGQARLQESQNRLEEFQALPIPKLLHGKPEQAGTPPIACVMGDGGRFQLLDRKETRQAASKSRKGTHWRESRVACLLSMQGPEHFVDPMPAVPKFLLDTEQISRLFSEMGHGASLEESDAMEPSSHSKEVWPGPDVLVRSVVARHVDWESFGPHVACEAWNRGFATSPRRVFVGDGSKSIWTMHKKHFSNYEPVLDILHALGYCYQSAVAGRRTQEGIAVYHRWSTWVWQGEVSKVIEELEARSRQLGAPQEEDQENDPRSIVHRALTYFRNQQSKMNYPEYRKKGFPITSSYIESTIKQINRRVKGTEKFWSRIGADALLGLSADMISDTEPLKAFWKRRASHHPTKVAA
jgi:hypothetical protein